MPRQPSAYNKVRQTLKDICTERPDHWPTAQDVADRAGVSLTTARRHLEANRGLSGYRSRSYGGPFMYRYDVDPDPVRTANIARAVAFLLPGQF